MIIFHKSVMIGRERARTLYKRAYTLTFTLSALESKKNDYLDQINELDPESDNYDRKLKRLNRRISLIDAEIIDNEYRLEKINDQINNLNYRIKDTLAPRNDQPNDHIAFIHPYYDLKYPTFAPSYPIRLHNE